MDLIRRMVVTGLVGLLAAGCGSGSNSSAPKAPTNVRAEAGPGLVTVRWDYSQSAGVSFDVYRETLGADGLAAESSRKANDASLGAEVRLFEDTDVSATASYRYAVTASASGGTSLRVVTAAPVTPAPSARGYRLEILRNGGGQGVVTSSPTGIACVQRPGETGDCSETYPAGQLVTLTAQADSGSSFTGWSGDCNGTVDCTVTLDKDVRVTATFAEAKATLSVVKTGQGKVVSSPLSLGIDCGNDCSETLNSGTVVVLQAEPSAGKTFKGWGAPCSGTGECRLTLENDLRLDATFDDDLALPTIERFGSSAGTIKAGETLKLSWQVANAESLSLRAADGTPQDVTGKTEATVSPKTTTVYTLSARNARGEVKRQLTVTVGSLPVIGSFNATPERVSVGEMSTLTWSVSGGEGLTFSIDNGVGVVTGSSIKVAPDQTTTYTLTAKNAYGEARKSVEVKVTSPLYLLTVVQEGDGKVVSEQPSNTIDCGSDCSERYAEGTPVELKANRRGSFEGWYGCDTFEDNICRLTMDRDRTVIAYFGD